MASRDEIVAYLDELLDIGSFDDLGPNGLQVPGSEQVELVVTGVSAHRELFEQAAAAGAELVVAHHGLFWDFLPRTVGTAMKERLRILFDADISVAGYHLPLDAHPEVGNNALICAAARAGARRAVRRVPRADVGFVGRSAEGVPFDELRRRCESAFGQEPFVWDSGPELVRSVGHHLGRRRLDLRRGDRARPRRVRHRRAGRARDGGRARERRALHRRRPLRDRDLRRPPPRRAPRGALRRTSTVSSTRRTRSEPILGGISACADRRNRYSP